MTKCPDHETLSLFVDCELDKEELAKVRQHVESCRQCHADLQNMVAEESLLRSGVNESFARHRTVAKIMEEIRVNPCIAPVSKTVRGFWSMFTVRVVALALILLTVWFMTSTRPQFSGTVMSVACQALNNNSSINGAIQPLRQKFALSRSSAALVNGHFLFSMVATCTSEFEVKGQAEVALDELHQPVFRKAEVELLWVTGPEVTLKVNDELVLISRKTHLDEATASACSAIEPAKTSTLISPTISSKSFNINGTVDITLSEKVFTASSSAIATGENSVGEIVPIVPLNNDENGKEFNKNPFSEEPIGINGD